MINIVNTCQYTLWNVRGSTCSSPLMLLLLQQRTDTISNLWHWHFCWGSFHWPIKSRHIVFFFFFLMWRWPIKSHMSVPPVLVKRSHWPTEEPLITVRPSCASQGKFRLTIKEPKVQHSWSWLDTHAKCHWPQKVCVMQVKIPKLCKMQDKAFQDKHTYSCKHSQVLSFLLLLIELCVGKIKGKSVLYMP